MRNALTDAKQSLCRAYALYTKTWLARNMNITYMSVAQTDNVEESMQRNMGAMHTYAIPI